MLTIGFATEFYTLWSITSEVKYFVGANGNAYPQHETTTFTYLQNISKDLATVKAKYPDLEIYEDLKGKTHSWVKTSKEDLTPHILKFGKHYGESVYDLVKTDFNYILWLADNAGGQVALLCSSLPEVFSFLEAAEKRKQQILDSFPIAESGSCNLFFLTNPNYLVERDINLDAHPELSAFANNYFAEATLGEGNKIAVIFGQIKQVSGLYPYNMAFVNGKAQKVKGKSINVNLNILKTDKRQSGVRQIAVLK